MELLLMYQSITAQMQTGISNVAFQGNWVYTLLLKRDIGFFLFFVFSNLFFSPSEENEILVIRTKLVLSCHLLNTPSSVLDETGSAFVHMSNHK